MTAKINTAGHCHKRSSGHPVRCRSHPIEQGWDLTSCHIIGFHLHRPGKPANSRINYNGKYNKQNTNRFGTHTHLFKDCHQDDEGNETTRV